jgi:6-phosphogluconolactonase
MTDLAQDVIVGGFTPGTQDGRGVGITRYRSGPDGELRPIGDPVAMPSPSYLVRHPELPLLYAITEGSPGLVHTLRVDADGGLELVGTVSAGDDGPGHLEVSADARHVIVGNYAGGSVSTITIGDDGVLVGVADLMRFPGSGPDPERQEASHPHQVVVDGDQLLVPDLGVDAIHRLTIDTDGRLHHVDSLETPPGSGPRHVVVVGDLMAVALELSAEVLVAQRQGAGWTTRQVLPSSSARVAERIYPSAIRARGNSVFVANRGAGTLSEFALDPESGAATKVREFPCGGSWPRDLVIDGSHLWVANQADDVVTVFDDTLTPPATIAEFPSPTPACIILLDR